MDLLLAGLVLGLLFALVDYSVLLPTEWANRRQLGLALVLIGAARVMVALLVTMVDLGAPRWLWGAALGGAISLPFMRLGDRFPAVLPLGVTGGFVVGLAAGTLHMLE